MPKKNKNSNSPIKDETLRKLMARRKHGTTLKFAQKQEETNFDSEVVDAFSRSLAKQPGFKDLSPNTQMKKMSLIMKQYRIPNSGGYTTSGSDTDETSEETPEHEISSESIHDINSFKSKPNYYNHPKLHILNGFKPKKIKSKPKTMRISKHSRSKNRSKHVFKMIKFRKTRRK